MVCLTTRLLKRTPTYLLTKESSAQRWSNRLIDASTLGGGRDIIPALNGEQYLRGFRVKRLPVRISCKYIEPASVSVTGGSASCAASPVVHVVECGWDPLWEFVVVGLAPRCEDWPCNKPPWVALVADEVAPVLDTSISVTKRSSSKGSQYYIWVQGTDKVPGMIWKVIHITRGRWVLTETIPRDIISRWSSWGPNWTVVSMLGYLMYT
jgi:hypothetical protein